MDYPRDNVFTFLFSTYKRATGIAFTAIIILAIPITILLLSRQQDIRQRASENTTTPTQCIANANCPSGYTCVGATPASNENGGTPTLGQCLINATATPSPTSTTRQQQSLNKKLFDLNDDGAVDEQDKNILYAAFIAREGD